MSTNPYESKNSEAGLSQAVENFRAFNRFYTPILGLLNQHYLKRGFSLAEARVLYEVAIAGMVQPSRIAKSLHMDLGQLSRITKKLIKQRLVSSSVDANDSRCRTLKLTSLGKKAFVELNSASEEHARNLLSRLSKVSQHQVHSCLATVCDLLKKEESVGDPYIIVRDFTTGDVGWTIWRHARIYEDEYGFNVDFEAYVAEEMGHFVRNFDFRYERMLVVESGDNVVGAAAVARLDEKIAQFRWFYLENHVRGQGLGRRLLKETLNFARRAGYKQVILWTVDVLQQAHKLYSGAGFNCIERLNRKTLWGQNLVEQKWQLDL